MLSGIVLAGHSGTVFGSAWNANSSTSALYSSANSPGNTVALK